MVWCDHGEYLLQDCRRQGRYYNNSPGLWEIRVGGNARCLSRWGQGRPKDAETFMRAICRDDVCAWPDSLGGASLLAAGDFYCKLCNISIYLYPFLNTTPVFEGFAV